jgi:AcrR family transcriptional regulator
MAKPEAAAGMTLPASLAERARGAARGVRQRAVADVKRSLVLAAARSAFIELGLEGASLREIAKRAGYTPGAIYSYFASKEEVYGALLGESLERLNACVEAAVPAPTRSRAAPVAVPVPVPVLRAKATAFFDFYRENPRDLDLGFYLFHGMQPRGLTPALNERLNARLRDALAPTERALGEIGMRTADARLEVTALFAHIVGLLLMSHTGRIRMFGQASAALFERYLEALVVRALAASKPRGARP